MPLASTAVAVTSASMVCGRCSLLLIAQNPPMGWRARRQSSQPNYPVGPPCHSVPLPRYGTRLGSQRIEAFAHVAAWDKQINWWAGTTKGG
eukprot:782024-Prymnesium_polylepis.1